jgi:SAM-dependent methyltransferase
VRHAGASLGTSYRRMLLDAELTRVTVGLRGRVLDVGGRRRARGSFRAPAGAAWIRINVDAREGPDVVGDAQALPVRGGTADTVLCLETLEYVEAPERAVAELARVLRPGGRAVVSVPFLHRADSATDRHRFTETRLRELLEQGGLTVVEIVAQGRFFTALANMLRQATAGVGPRPLRWALAGCTLPLGAALLRLDRLRRVRHSAFLCSFATGFLAQATKPAPGSAVGLGA